MGYITIDGEKFYVESKCYESIIQGNKKYREKNRDKINKKNKEYKKKKEKEEETKEDKEYKKLYEKYRKVVKCDCGRTYIYPYNEKRHFKTRYHINYLNRYDKEKEIIPVLDLSLFDAPNDDIIPLQSIN